MRTPLGPDAQLRAFGAGCGLCAETQRRFVLACIVGSLDFVDGIAMRYHGESPALAGEDASIRRLVRGGGHGRGGQGHDAAEGGLERETHDRLEFSSML